MAGLLKGFVMTPFLILVIAFVFKYPWLLLLPVVGVIVMAIVANRQVAREIEAARQRRAASAEPAPLRLELQFTRTPDLPAPRPRRRARR